MKSSLSIARARRRIATGTTHRQLIDEVLERAASSDAAHVFLSVDAEGARAAADAVDRAGRGYGPIAGLPITIKDLFDIEGEVTRAGSRVLVSGMRRGLRRHFRTGTLSKSIKTKAKYYAKGDVMVVVVGVSSDPSANGVFRGKRITPYRYSHFVTNPRRGFMQECPRKSGRFRWIGPNTPDDYITKATLTGRSEVIAAMQKVIYDAVR